MDFLESLLIIGYFLNYGYFALGKHSCADFHYTKEKTHTLYLDPFARSPLDDTCKLCYGREDCIVIEESWCPYYLETSKILSDDSEGQALEETTNIKLKHEVDDVMFDMMKKAAVDDDLEECIPFVSQYTNCNKDTICTGCQSCTCDVHGMWTCAPVEQCRPRQVTLDVNHRVLLLAMESLLGLPLGGNRVKRSYKEEPTDQDIIYKKIADWMNDVKPQNLKDIVVKPENKILKHMMEEIFEEMKRNISGVYNADSDSFTFNDLMRNVEDIDPVQLRDHIKPWTDRIIETTTAKETAISGFEEILQIDNSTKDDFKDENMSRERFMDMIEQGDFIPAAVVKRDLDNVNNVTITNNKNNTTNATTTNRYNSTNSPITSLENTVTINNDSHISISNNLSSTTESIQNLNDNVLVPIDSIISSKQNEIDELQRIRTNIIKYFKKDQLLNITSNITKHQEINTHFALYKLEFYPTLPSAIMRTGPNDVMTVKDSIDLIKRDLIRVLRDVAVLRKVINGEDIPKDLKYLVSAIRYYIQEQARHQEIKLQRSAFFFPDTETDTIKEIASFNGQYSRETNYMKDGLMKILRLIDTEIPQSNALSPLSIDAKKVMKRIIHLFISNEVISSQINLNVNLIKELTYTDLKLTKLLKKFNVCKVNYRLHKLKLIYLEVSVIINKLSKILETIDVVGTKRIHIDEKEAKTIIRNINKKIEHIILNIDRFFLLFKETNREIKVNNEITTKNAVETKKKTSLLERLKTIMKNFVHKKKKVNSSEDTMNDLTEKQIKDYEDSMMNWHPIVKPKYERNKRSPSERLRKLKNRIQNIIPKYLRKKFNPAILNKTIAKKKKAHKLSKRHTNILMGDISTISKESTYRHASSVNKKIVSTTHPKKQTKLKKPTRYVSKYYNKLGSIKLNGTGTPAVKKYKKKSATLQAEVLALNQPTRRNAKYLHKLGTTKYIEYIPLPAESVLISVRSNNTKQMHSATHLRKKTKMAPTIRRRNNYLDKSESKHPKSGLNDLKADQKFNEKEQLLSVKRTNKTKSKRHTTAKTKEHFFENMWEGISNFFG